MDGSGALPRYALKAVEAEGFVFTVCGEATDPYFINAQNFARENRLIPAALRSLRRDPVIIDVGANIGVTAALAAAARPEARIIAVEPSARARAGLARTAVAGGFTNRLRVIPECVGAMSGEVQFHEAESPCASHVWTDEGGSRMRMATLDQIAADPPLHLIDLVKIDVEGWEIDVIRGGAACLRYSAPLVIAEVNTWALNWTRGIGLREVIEEIRATFGLAAWIEDDRLRIVESRYEFYALAWAIEQSRGLDIAFCHDHAKVRRLAQFARGRACAPRLSVD